MRDSELRIGLVLLAAGASARMRQPKQLMEISGRPLVRHCAMAALASPARPVAVILGSGADLIRPHLADIPLLLAVNPDWEAGMGSSLSFGLGALLEEAPDLDAVVVALADHPHLSGELIRRLIEQQAATGKSIVASLTRGQTTPPVLFLRRHFAALLGATGDRGANFLLRQHATEVATVEVPHAIDLDTPEDCARFFGRQ